mgnify:CR=1 FL=1
MEGGASPEAFFHFQFSFEMFVWWRWIVVGKMCHEAIIFLLNSLNILESALLPYFLSTFQFSFEIFIHQKGNNNYIYVTGITFQFSFEIFILTSLNTGSSAFGVLFTFNFLLKSSDGSSILNTYVGIVFQFSFEIFAVIVLYANCEVAYNGFQFSFEIFVSMVEYWLFLSMLRIFQFSFEIFIGIWAYYPTTSMGRVLSIFFWNLL